MAQSQATKKFFNMAYGLGASIVILGALFKILHWPLGNEMLMVGMIAESIVFAIAAFEPVEDDLDWSKVYPELAGGTASEKGDVQGMLSQKLDDMLEEAKLDAGLIRSLGDSILNFKGAADNIAPIVGSIESTNRYNEQMSLAAAQMESLNSLYQVQLENNPGAINSEMVENANSLKEQMESLAANLSSLNGVYGGMLTAMSKN
ncbi:MAG: gliding motility protein GldL [Flavobacteriaceae bacterium]|nr:gliding motility protein GldL [Flavobacteriaceae bacterium]